MPNSDAFQQIYARVDPAISHSLLAFRRDWPLTQVRVDGNTWRYVTSGQRDEAILFLHGMAGSYDIWWQVLDILKERYQVLSLTYPPVAGLQALARGITAVLAKEHLSQVSVVGSSLGGYLAQYLVARHPGKIRRAVFANTFPPNDIIAGNTRLVAKLLPFIPAGLMMYSLRQNTERRLYPASGNSEVVRAYLLEQYQGGMSKAQFVARYRCVIEPFDPPKADRLGIPILILEADNDPLISKKLRAMLQDTYLSATLQCLGNVGHFPYLNEPVLYGQIILRFLGSELQAQSR